MSKIYEALLRAENEKVVHGVTTADPASEQESFRRHLDHDNVRERDGHREASVGLLESTPNEGATKSSQPVPATTVQVWRPDLDRLPAVQSRGGKIEQFRSLRSKITGLRHVQQLKSIYVGSGFPGEGKSFVASNLAVTLARQKTSRVLLIDGDMRRGTLHKVLGSPNEVGLAEYLSGKADRSRSFQRGRSFEGDAPLPPGVSNLTFCSCGNAGDRAAELSGSSRFPELLRTIASDFDWIIVDSSPVNVISDGVNLARACDSTLLVVRGGVTKFETAQRAVRELKEAKLLGVVLNAVGEFAPNEGNYGYQSYESVAE